MQRWACSVLCCVGLVRRGRQQLLPPRKTIRPPKVRICQPIPTPAPAPTAIAVIDPVQIKRLQLVLHHARLACLKAAGLLSAGMRQWRRQQQRSRSPLAPAWPPRELRWLPRMRNASPRAPCLHPAMHRAHEINRHGTHGLELTITAPRDCPGTTRQHLAHSAALSQRLPPVLMTRHSASTGHRVRLSTTKRSMPGKEGGGNGRPLRPVGSRGEGPTGQVTT